MRHEYRGQRRPPATAFGQIVDNQLHSRLHHALVRPGDASMPVFVAFLLPIRAQCAAALIKHALQHRPRQVGIEIWQRIHSQLFAAYADQHRLVNSLDIAAHMHVRPHQRGTSAQTIRRIVIAWREDDLQRVTVDLHSTKHGEYIVEQAHRFG